MKVYWPEPKPNTRYYGRIRIKQHPDGYLYSEEAPYDEDYLAGARGGLAQSVVMRQGAPFSFPEAGRASKGHGKSPTRPQSPRARGNSRQGR